MNLIRAALLTSAVVLATAASAQETAMASSSFEVISIRPSGPAAHLRSMRGGPGSPDPGHIYYTDVTPQLLMIRAFRVRPNEIHGPDWIASVGFDIAAKLPPSTTEEQFRLMLKKLLEERFSMIVHRETKRFPTYVLVTGKSAPKLPPADGSSTKRGCRMIPNAASRELEMQVECRNATISALAERLPFFAKINTKFVDETHLEGSFDFDLTWRPALSQDHSGPGSAESTDALFQAMDKQLGLKVQERMVSVEIIVVDRLNKAPTDN